MQRKCGFVLKSCLVCYFICSSSIFISWTHHAVTLFPFFVTPSRFHPHTQQSDEAKATLNSYHSTSTSAVHSENFRVWGLLLYSVRPPNLARLFRPCWFFKMCVADYQVVIGRQFEPLLTQTSNTERNKSSVTVQKSTSDRWFSEPLPWV